MNPVWKRKRKRDQNIHRGRGMVKLTLEMREHQFITWAEFIIYKLY